MTSPPGSPPLRRRLQAARQPPVGAFQRRGHAATVGSLRGGRRAPAVVEAADGGHDGRGGRCALSHLCVTIVAAGRPSMLPPPASSLCSRRQAGRSCAAHQSWQHGGPGHWPGQRHARRAAVASLRQGSPRPTPTPPSLPSNACSPLPPAGYGLTEAGQPSDSLRYTDLEVLAPGACPPGEPLMFVLRRPCLHSGSRQASRCTRALPTPAHHLHPPVPAHTPSLT